ncbi:sulfur reduction protein DsrE [Marinobacter salinexigens]|uniref:Sulfur reduction protein DsrE n=1 Tax=Marinobacter salinexigens TaxID=2919747 RepID=A0A5B0VMG1_9GAMM|nr:DsrE family protein [Marinobacter salinexigens]KAA1175161.1 sulfur reduction protein DsrE [Marinobacter salinexigens]
METLIVIDQAPYGSFAGREALDMAFSLAAFDQPASLLFTGAGVHWLRKGQAPDSIHQKSVEKNLSAAPIFGIEQLLVDSASCERFGLTVDDLPDGITLIDGNADMIGRYQNVLFAG